LRGTYTRSRLNTCPALPAHPTSYYWSVAAHNTFVYHAAVLPEGTVQCSALRVRPRSIVRRAAVARSFQAFSAAFSSRGPVSVVCEASAVSPKLTLKNGVTQSGGTIKPAPSTTARTLHYSPRYSTHESLLFAEHHKYCRPKLSITIVCSSVQRASAVS